MREDYQEQLDKMFPRGYVIVYTFPNSDDIRMAHYNPKFYEEIERYRELVLNNWKE